jgi:amidase
MDDLHCLLSGPIEPTGSGSLDGVSFAVKDLISIAGHVSSFGHPRWRETHEAATTDAAIVARTRAAGGRIIGTTKMEQLAYSLIGNIGEGAAPLNSFDREAYCGGSSSGSAAAVAGSLAAVGIGTDTAGSIRVPAAACGLVGIRPTHGRIDDGGVVPMAPSFDVVGLLTRSPDVMKLAFESLATPTPSPVPISAVLLPDDIWHGDNTIARSSANRLARQIALEHGAEVKSVSFDEFVDDASGALFARLQGREIWSQHATWVAGNMKHLVDEVQERLQICEARADDPAETQAADLEMWHSYQEKLRQLVRPGTIVIVPIRQRRGPLIAWSGNQLREFRRECFNLMAPSSLTGMPQITIPTITEGAYAPLGVIGAANSDEMLIDLACEVIGGAPGPSGGAERD